MGIDMERAAPRDAEGGPQRVACLAASYALNTVDSSTTQDAISSRCASPEAIGAARDLAFEGLVETGSLAESYSRSLTEAAWRGDRLTVEVTLKQLRLCVVSAIDTFKLLDGGRVGA
jgi:hypothetical protein